MKRLDVWLQDALANERVIVRLRVHDFRSSSLTQAFAYVLLGKEAFALSYEHSSERGTTTVTPNSFPADNNSDFRKVVNFWPTPWHLRQDIVYCRLWMNDDSGAPPQVQPLGFSHPLVMAHIARFQTASSLEATARPNSPYAQACETIARRLDGILKASLRDWAAMIDPPRPS